MVLSTSAVQADGRYQANTIDDVIVGGRRDTHPRISLVVSTVGRPEALERLLRSLKEETAESLAAELVVVDQSPDGCCLPVLTGYAHDGRESISWIYVRSSIGVSKGRNIGLALATGELVMFPDDDAWFSGTTLRRAVAHLASHPEHDGLCSQLQDGEGELSMLRWAPTPRLVTKHNHHRTSIGSTMIFRTERGPVDRRLRRDGRARCTRMVRVV